MDRSLFRCNKPSTTRHFERQLARRKEFSLNTQRWMVVGCTLLSLAATEACRRRRPAAENGTGGQGSANPEQQPTAPTTPTTPQVGISGTQTGESSVRSVPPSPASGCPAQRPNAELGPGTVHNSAISMNETWTLEGSPHRFPDGASVQENVTVTVVPCAVILIGNDQSFSVQAGASLIAVGDAQHPIRISSDKTAPQPGDWDELVIHEQARRTTCLAYTTIEYGGGDTGGSIYSCLHTLNPETDLQHVLFRACRGYGIFAENNARFSQSSEDVTVREGVVGGTTNAGSVYFTVADAVGSLPSGTYAGNEISEIFIGDGDRTVKRTATWRNPGVRYHIGDNLDIRVEGPTAPILTIAPGSTLAFGTHSSLSVGFDAEGSLVADGLAEATRITFTSAAAEPSPSTWNGISIGERAGRTRTKFAWVNLAYAGADDASGAPCAWNEAEDDGALRLFQALPAESVTHVTFTGQSPNVASILRAATPTVNYGASNLGNNFAQSGSTCHQSPTQTNGGCPERVACD